jgi:hypothetical protein
MEENKAIEIPPPVEEIQIIGQTQPIYPNWKKKVISTQLKPHKSNSTSTLFVDSTISSPKTPELVRCVAEWFQKHILPSDKGTTDMKILFEIWDEGKHPITSKKVDVQNIPPVPLVEKYIRDIFKVGQLAPESLIMAVAYLERIMTIANFQMFPFSWRRIILSCLILASKVWEDQAVWNVDFIDMFPLTTPYDLGQMEKKLLSLLSFDVSLRASQYAKIYFDLRAQVSGAEEQFLDLKPLDKEGQERLELITSNFTEKHITDTLKTKLPRSSGSFDNINGLKSPRAVLN